MDRFGRTELWWAAKDGRLDDVEQLLAARADAAIALYMKKRVSKILVTGDNGELSHDEVTPVAPVPGEVGDLGLGRALGETMAVTMVIGNKYVVTPSLFSPGTTIASKIAGEFGEAVGEVFISSLVELALVLFGVTLLVNIIARLLVWQVANPAMRGQRA